MSSTTISSLTGSSSASSSSSSASTINNGRYWGLASGLDVDSIVTALVSGKQTQIDQANQQKQLLQWKQTAYQSIISSLNTFQSTYLDILGSSSILSSKTYAVYAASSDNAAISVLTTADASGGTHSIKVTQSATTASFTGSQVGTTITGANNVTPSNLSNLDIQMTVDGVTKTINMGSIDSAATDSDMKNLLQSKIDNAFGSPSKVAVSINSGKISFAASGDYPSAVISIAPTSDEIKNGISPNQIMGLTQSSNRLSTSSTLAQAFGNTAFKLDSNGKIDANINGISFSFSPTDTLQSVFTKINNSKAGVNLSYSSTSGKITIAASASGASGLINATGNFIDTDSNTEDSGFFDALLGNGQGSLQNIRGKDAEFSIDGVNYTRSSNSFTIDGVNYTINKQIDPTVANSEQDANITLTSDTSGAVKALTDFVNAYNTLIDSINTQITTKPDSDYPPLTDAQKSKMSDSDITNWNTKAQSGLLFNDDTLNGIVSSMRSMLYQPVTTSTGKTMTLYSIGITESSDYTKNGELEIDNDKLTQALQNDPQAVQELFSKTSSTLYNVDGKGQTQRKQEEGLGYRLQDIISDATSTGVYPYVGSLVSIAGTPSSTSDDYELNKQLSDITDQITDYQTQMTDKKNQLYAQFTQLEQMMEQMNSQSSMISSFGSGS